VLGTWCEGDVSGESKVQKLLAIKDFSSLRRPPSFGFGAMDTILDEDEDLSDSDDLDLWEVFQKEFLDRDDDFGDPFEGYSSNSSHIVQKAQNITAALVGKSMKRSVP